MATRKTNTKGNKGTKNEMIEACGMTKDQMINEMRKINSKHSDNMDSRKSALKIMGVDYVLCVITVGLTQEQEAELFGCQGNGIKNILSGCRNCCIRQHGMNFHRHTAINLLVLCMKSEKSRGRK